MPTTLTVLPSATYPVGTATFGPVSIPVGATRITMTIDRAQLALFTGTISWAVDLSLDGGTTWIVPWAGASTTGGVVMSRGVPAALSHFAVDLPEPTNPNRMGRGSLTVDQPVTTAGVVILEP